MSNISIPSRPVELSALSLGLAGDTDAAGGRPDTYGLADQAVQGSLVPVAGRRGLLSRVGERGMISAEWALGMVAAVALVGAVIAAITSGPIHDVLVSIITQVLRLLTDWLPDA